MEVKGWKGGEREGRGDRGRGGMHMGWRRDKGRDRNREEERKKRERKEAMTEACSIYIHVTETDKQSCIYNFTQATTHTPPQHIQAVYDVIFQRPPLQAEVLHLLLDGSSSSHTRVGGEAFSQRLQTFVLHLHCPQLVCIGLEEEGGGRGGGKGGERGRRRGKRGEDETLECKRWMRQKWTKNGRRG